MTWAFLLSWILLPGSEGVILDWDHPEAAVEAADPREVEKLLTELGIRAQVERYSGAGRPLGYAGEDSGLLCFLLGLKPGPGGSWLRSTDMNIRIVGLGTHIHGEIPVSRAALVPLAGRRWLLLLSGAASLDAERLRRHMAASATRKQLLERITYLFRDAHQAFNSREPTPPRLAYPGLSRDELLDVGDPPSEELFELRTAGQARRVVERRDLPTGGRFIDDGIAVEKEGASIAFVLDLHPLISDDLLLVGRTAACGRGEVLVDGVPLADWVPEEAAGAWGEAVVRIPNRLLEGKKKAAFELRPAGGQKLTLFRLHVLRVPFSAGEYLPNRSVEEGPLVVAGYRFLYGLRLRAPSEYTFALEGSREWFEAFIGVDARAADATSLVFRVLVDGEERFKSPNMDPKSLPRTVRVALREGKKLQLVVEGQGGGDPVADWAEARLLQ